MTARPDTARKVLLYWMDGLVGLYMLGITAYIVLRTAQGRISVPRAVAAEACLLTLFGLFPFLLRHAFDARPRPTVQLAVAGLAAAAAVALVPAPPDGITIEGSWAMVAFLWLSAAVLYLPVWGALALSVVVVGLTSSYVILISGRPWPGVLVTEAVTAAVTAVAMWLWRWLWWTIRDAHDSKEAKARLAVSEERLRFARDLHDLLGHSLSVITLKSELAAKLATKDAGRAAREMADVRRLVADSLAEVRQAVDGYQALDLEAELAGVRAALEAAGTRCTIEARAGDLSPAARVLLAWVVREGGTNVLKHSAATRCAITIDGGVLEMRNDGVRGPAAGPGSGLRGLAERMTTAGGSLTATGMPDGEFVLRAAVPA
ncbi:sensor histidine kinase [Nonomuraea muscovyensis]|uniref:Two-component system sensor histidine kinase DesK n=1 Tax=Nonomuraea muscovyensis TaxID=1124761 RepID=A0A7X0C6Y7_9ACTN|nr:histidine kinase [Nonomuraea muscovyensis]MBB6349298.1 two-component system sensor histidine kinase DesK [Nonomuraea muscovyensis]